MKKHICIWLASIVMIFLTAGCSTNANNGTPNAGFKATPKPADTTSRISVAEISPAKGESTNKILVAYFSHSGNTRQIAKYIHEDVGGDIYEITPVNPYPENYDAVVARVRQERAVDARPALTAKVENMEAYNVIFVGFPNWGSDMPKPVYTFLEQYDFKYYNLSCDKDTYDIANNDPYFIKQVPFSEGSLFKMLQDNDMNIEELYKSSQNLSYRIKPYDLDAFMRVPIVLYYLIHKTENDITTRYNHFIADILQTI